MSDSFPDSVELPSAQFFLSRFSVPWPLYALILLFWFALPAFGQESRYSLTSWKVEDGLPQGSVRSVTQTKDGYLWAATWNGLARFDGINFTTYHTANTPALLSSSITVVFGDSRGTLWIGTDGGGAVRFAKGIFTRMDSVRGIPAKRVLDIIEDHEGRIWFSTERGFYCLRKDTVRHFSSKNGLIHDYAGCVLPGPDGTLYFGMINDASRVRVRDDSLVIESTFPVGGFRLDVDSAGALWYFLPGRGLIRRVGDGEIIDRRFPGTDPRDVFLPGDGRIWFATSKGLYIVSGNRVELLKQVDGVNLDHVVVVFRDREGNFWLSSSGKGLLRLRPRYVQPFSKLTGFVSDMTMCGLQDRTGAEWIGTWDQGLFRRKPSAQAITPESFEHTRLPLRTFSILDLKEFRDGSIWIGTWVDGVVKFNNNRFSLFRPGTLREGFSVTSVAQGKDGSVWVGTAHDGVFHYDKGLHEERWNMARGLGDNEISVLMCQKNGDIWIGTSGGGVSRISNGAIRTLTRQQGLTDNFVSTILEDGDGTVWIATVRGLNRWKAVHPDEPGSDGVLSPITERNGLYDDATDQLIESGEDLWIGSIHGIYRVKKKDLNAVADGSSDQVLCLRLGKSDGMVSEECGARGNSRTWKTADERLWFSTSGGAVAFDPHNIGETKLPPDVIVEEVAVDNKPVALEPAIVLQPGQTKLDVRYTGINFSAPRSIRFKYILDGSDKEWVNAGGERIAHYTNLDPGHFALRVIASNNSGIWSEQAASMTVTVLPPFWATWWFRIGAFIIVVGAIGWTVRWIEMRKIREKIHAMERQAAIERERLRIARDLHDELGSRLTEIGLMTDLARGRKAKEKEGHLKEIGSTARGIVDSFREIVWTVGPQHDTLDSLAEYVSQYVSTYLRKANIRCRLELPDEFPTVPVQSETRHGILMAVKEATNNIVKHSAATEVRLDIQINESMCVIELQDNGKGFSTQNSRRFSHGLENMNKRMEAVGGTAEVGSENRKGTTVTFAFPLSNGIAVRS